MPKLGTDGVGLYCESTGDGTRALLMTGDEVERSVPSDGLADAAVGPGSAGND